LTNSRPSDTDSQATHSSRYPYYVLAILFLVYMINFFDRYLLSILIEPIKEELGVSDSAIGFLTGFAFAIFYTTAGIPIARWADRGSRRGILALGLTLWSGMTALCGVAQSFAHLAIARIGVGVGEAAGSPPAHSLISDYFPPEKRATAMSIYNMGLTAGIMFGFIAGGWITQFFNWRVAFFCAGVPGIVLALVVRFTIHEPPRGATESGTADTEHYPLGAVVRYLFGIPSFAIFATATGLLTFSSYAMDLWSAPFLMRVHDMKSGETGTWLGIMSGLSGFGFLIGGMWADRWGRKDPRAYLWVPGIGAILSYPFSLAFLLIPHKLTALCFYLPAITFSAFFLGPVIAIAHRLVRVRMRALTSAVLFFILNLIGLGLGPQAVGILNDVLNATHGELAIRYSMVIVMTGKIFAAIFFMWAGFKLLADLRKTDATTSA